MAALALNCSNRGKRTEKDKDEILAVMMTARKGEVNCQRRRDEKGRRGDYRLRGREQVHKTQSIHFGLGTIIPIKVNSFEPGHR